ncbi:ABC transporter substrate-binding protein [Natranaerobius thermophilus]|uniref:Periplasmic binding protein n=1 Tax=Natranaerobius thermophilus (strain ATCC BAA-1301 / DSM 18059 / JW/NM-WN-LF) TaxID=457570 RepID=B2A265_NATTJ|nr:ABC transporter substrate-binding protein [Natranaerobius thermophilus]ACB86173.1 periplasmic binding protein [Natranaerobius thermophilus JW/NM-WN-LF]
MKKELSYIITILLISLMMALGITGCQGQQEDQVSQEKASENQEQQEKEQQEKDQKEQQEQEKQQEQITIVDSEGRSVEVPSPPEKVVVANSNINELLYILESEDKTVGVADSITFPPEAQEYPEVGSVFSPNAEKILELDPDIVFGFGQYMDQDIKKQIELADIPVVFLDGYKIETLTQDIRTMGLIMDRESQAEEYIDFIEGHMQLITDRIDEIEDEDKVSVYSETQAEYSAYASGSGAHQALLKAGGVNLAGNEPGSSVTISDEWILEQDPDVIVKNLSDRNVAIGYEEDSHDEITEELAAMVDRPGWDELTAVNEDRVVGISTDLYTSPRSVVGLSYLAKWFYPEQFNDVEPKEIHRELLEEYYGLEYQGVWVYPHE